MSYRGGLRDDVLFDSGWHTFNPPWVSEGGGRAKRRWPGTNGNGDTYDYAYYAGSYSEGSVVPDGQIRQQPQAAYVPFSDPVFSSTSSNGGPVFGPGCAINGDRSSSPLAFLPLALVLVVTFAIRRVRS